MTYPTDDAGHPQVDFVWGNFPMQPNDERGGDDLDPSLDNHIIAEIGYANYPQFIPNYDGITQFGVGGAIVNDDSQNDGEPDSGLEFVVPTLLRKSLQEANDILDKYSVGTWDVAHYITASYVLSTGTTVRVTGYDTDYAVWSNTSNQALVGLRKGDQVDLSQLTDDQIESTNLGLGTVTVTKVNNDGSNSWFEFTSDTDLELDTAAAGSVYAGPNLEDIITVVRPNRDAGTIQNFDGQGIPVRYIGIFQP